MAFGLKGIIKIVVCCLLSLNFYIPGLVYALLITTHLGLGRRITAKIVEVLSIMVLESQVVRVLIIKKIVKMLQFQVGEIKTETQLGHAHLIHKQVNVII